MMSKIFLLLICVTVALDPPLEPSSPPLDQSTESPPDQDVTESKHEDASLRELFAIPKSEFYAGSVAFSQDGSLLAEAGFQTVRVWSVDEKKLVQEFKTKGMAQAVTFNPEGNMVVVADGVGNLGYLSTLYGWHVGDRSKEHLGECRGAVSQIRFSPDGEKIAALSNYGFILGMTRSSEPTKEIGEAPRPRKENWHAGELSVYQILAAQPMLKVYFELESFKPTEVKDSDELSEKYQESLMDEIPFRFCFSDDGQVIATSSFGGKAKIYDLNQKKSIVDFETDGGDICFDDGAEVLRCASQSFDLDGKSLATSNATPWLRKFGPYAFIESENKQLVAIHIESGERIGVLPDAVTPRGAFAISKNGRLLAARVDSEVKVWTVK